MSLESSGHSDSAPTRQLGQYKLLRKLGQGGMGAVFLAEDSMLLRQVAVKVLPKKFAANQEFLARFKREAQAAGRLSHPNIVGAYAVGEEAGIPYYVMEYCAGESLEEVLKRTGRLPWQEAVALTKQIADGLGYAHTQGLLHRDIKPANILMTPEHQAKVLDLGLAKHLGEEGSTGFQTLSGTAVGTPHYIAPEQARGEKNLDGRADIYSLGATLYHLVTGSTPFKGATSPAIMAMHLTEEPPSPSALVPDLPDGLLQIIAKMMSKAPPDRYSNCGLLIEDLAAVLAGAAPPHASRVALRPAAGRAGGRSSTTGPRAPVARREEEGARVGTHPPAKPGLVIGVLGGVAVLVVGLVLVVGGRQDEEQVQAAAKNPARTKPPPVPSAPSVPVPPKTLASEPLAPARLPAPIIPPPPAFSVPGPAALPAAVVPPAVDPELKTMSAAPAIAITVEAPIAQAAPAAVVPQPAPALSKRPVLRLRVALEWALADEPFAQTEAKIRADLELAEVSEKDACERLAQMLNWAAAVPHAAVQQIRSLAGGKLKVLLQEGGFRMMAVEKDDQDALWVDYGAGKRPLRLEDLSPETVGSLAKSVLGGGKEAEERLAAHAVLRGDMATARRLLSALPPEEKALAEKILEERARKIQEAKAVEETGRFLGLAGQQKYKEALALGEQLLKACAGTQAVESLAPPLELQLEDLRSRLAGLKGVFLCDYKKLPDGRVQLDFDFSKPAHCFELLNRSLSAVFTELDASLSFQNDSRWQRTFHLGEATFTHHQQGGQLIEHEKKRDALKHLLPTGATGQAHGADAERRYRLKASPQGFSFQVDEERPQVLAAAWKGGRLKWPSHNTVAPEKLTLTGRLDPRWLNEMSEVAAERAQFSAPGGAYVTLKPKARAVPRPDLEPWFDAYSYNPNPDLETRTILGWHEIGPSWSLEKGEYVSPNPPPSHSPWISWFWPAALVSAHAEIAFEAWIEKGALELRLPTLWDNRAVLNWHSLDLLVLEKESVRVEHCYFFLGSPGRMEKDIAEKVRKPVPPAKPGKWQQIQILNRKDSIQVYVEGLQVLDFKRPSSDKLALAFLAHPKNAYRIRNVKIRKLD